MKKIEAVFRPEKLDAVKSALDQIGYHGMTVSRVIGQGRQKGLVLQWRVGEYRVDLLPKVKIEIVVLDNDVPRTLDAITRTARTGEKGDGKIFITPVDNAVRVRTGEEGENAI